MGNIASADKEKDEAEKNVLENVAVDEVKGKEDGDDDETSVTPKAMLLRELSKSQKDFDISKVKEILKGIDYPAGINPKEYHLYADTKPEGVPDDELPRAYWGDWPLHVLVGRPQKDNTPEMIKLVSFLADKQHPIDAQNMLGSTPLHRACSMGNVPMVDALLKQKASKWILNNKKMTAISIAAYIGNEDLLKLLVDNDPRAVMSLSKPNAEVGGMTAYDFATKQSIKEMINLYKNPDKTVAEMEKINAAIVQEAGGMGKTFHKKKASSAVSPIEETKE